MGSSVIGALRVNLGMDTAQFEQGAAKAQKTTKGLQGALGGFTSSFASVASGAAIGTAAVAAFTFAMDQAGQAAQNADDLSAAATKIGVTAEALQGLRFAAQDADIPLDQLDNGLASLNATLGALKSGIGDGRVKEAFAALGITDSQLASMHDASDLLPILADRISQVGTQAEQVQIAKKLGAEELLPLMQRGSEGIQALVEEFRRLGLMLDEGVVTQLADMSREMEKADARSKLAGMSIASVFVPAMVKLKEATANALVALNNYVHSQAFRDWVQLTTHGGIVLKAPPTAGAPVAATPKASPPRTTAPILTASRSTASRSGPARGPREETQAESFAKIKMDHARTNQEQADAAFKKAFDKTVINPDDLQVPITEGVQAGVGEGMARSREDIREGYRSAIAGGLDAAIYGGGKGLMSYLADQFKRSFVDSLADGLSKVLGDVVGGSKGSTWASIAKGVGSFLGAGHNALGTSNWRGGPTWVGERGPELLNLPRGSQITPNNKLGGGMQVVKVITEASPYFDTRVVRTTQPMVEQYSLAAAEGGATLAETSMASRRRTTLGSGRR
ncbi:hypothetical protein [Caulobacter sp. DWP3-1-3b2]|uniref:hypothetical protein n=1 Tax=Caulobacter sp. DWP3-1-3b2 TaxID=2804643 RepID=UPI003CE980E0